MPDTDSTFKSAREEAHEILQGMSISEFGVAVRDRIGRNAFQDRDEPDEQWKQRIINSLLQDFDNNEVFRNLVCRALHILTDHERKHKLVSKQVDLTRRATEASEQSASSAGSMLKAFWVAVGISCLAFILSCFALWRTW